MQTSPYNPVKMILKCVDCGSDGGGVIVALTVLSQKVLTMMVTMLFCLFQFSFTEAELS